MDRADRLQIQNGAVDAMVGHSEVQRGPSSQTVSPPLAYSPLFLVLQHSQTSPGRRKETMIRRESRDNDAYYERRNIKTSASVNKIASANKNFILEFANKTLKHIQICFLNAIHILTF